MYNLVEEIKYTGGILMFENILTKETVTFKDLEEIAFKIAYIYLTHTLVWRCRVNIDI